MSRNVFNLQSLLTYGDLVNGLKNLKRKKKFKVPYVKALFSRYIADLDKKLNNLGNFLNNEVKTDDQLKIFYSKLKKYKLDPYLALAISKPGSKGKYRPLLIPSPKDRLVFDSLYPILKSRLEVSLASRRLLGLGVGQDVLVCNFIHNIYKNYIKKDYVYCLTIDYASFFSSINRVKLLKKLRKLFHERDFITFLEEVMFNEITNGESVQTQTGVKIMEDGIPQGLSFSPLLACFYALEIDDIYLNNKQIIGYRYIDDIVIFGKNKQDLLNVLKKIIIKSVKLNIVVHALGSDKTRLIDLRDNKTKFLGIEISVNGLEIGQAVYEKFIKVIREEIFPREILITRNVNEIQIAYYRYINGWLDNYEKIALNRDDLYIKLNTLIKSYFSKDRKVRGKFYKANESWLKIKGKVNLRNM